MLERLINLYYRFLTYPKIWVQHLLFWSGAIAVALAAIVFAKVSAYGNGLFSSVIDNYPLLAILITPAGFALIVWFTKRVFVGAEGSGIPQVIAAIDAPEIANRASMLSLRIAAGKVFLTTLGLCVGASVGREGPTVQVGASVMHAMGNCWRPYYPPSTARAYLGGRRSGHRRGV